MTEKKPYTPKKGNGRKAYTRAKRTSSSHTAKCGSKRAILKDKIRVLRERVDNLELAKNAPDPFILQISQGDWDVIASLVMKMVEDAVNSRLRGLVGSPTAQQVMEATRFSPDPVGGQAHLSGNESLPSGGIADLPIEPARETLKRQAPVSSSKSRRES